MKNLIVFYSFSGNNRLLAQHLQKMLDADLREIVEPSPRTGFRILLDVLFRRTPKIIAPVIDWQQYNHVFLIAPIWAGRIATPLKAFLRLSKQHLLHYSFISLCGSGHNKKLRKELTQLTGMEPEFILELLVNDLLPPEKKNKIKYTSGYKVQPTDLKFFDAALDKQLPASRQLMVPKR
ncbi:flavodoxin family protein [Adhaeribacter rhizoryzae]|uniref:Flavodoxin family protein n=1 Tax=Adhaeribacter rhizoryzae TaxID=2607907 RepID=A0A5M6D0Z8_9BACT|nr:flavodoxin family protein [Adhaeribacter rhizoryzae]KAA5539962.1 flavodoxin family protein [Adhaeribacter rhizoryzae]